AEKRFDTGTGHSGHDDGSVVAASQCGHVVRSDIRLVEAQKFWYITGTDLIQNPPHRGHMTFRIGSGTIDDMDEQIRLRGDPQGRFERFDELMREFTNEADRVGEQYCFTTRKLDAACG